MSFLSRIRLLHRHLASRPIVAAKMTTHNTNKACCTIPAVQSDYQPKGTFKPFGEFQKVYVTGPENTESALVCIFDIFGYDRASYLYHRILMRILCLASGHRPSKALTSSRPR